jgi:hypothetical protein
MTWIARLLAVLTFWRRRASPPPALPQSNRAARRRAPLKATKKYARRKVRHRRTGYESGLHRRIMRPHFLGLRVHSARARKRGRTLTYRLREKFAAMRLGWLRKGRVAARINRASPRWRKLWQRERALCPAVTVPMTRAERKRAERKRAGGGLVNSPITDVKYYLEEI